MPPLCRLLLFVWLAAAADVAAAEWPLETADHLFAHYHKIFPNGNRNAASHRWATFILQRSGSMTLQKLEYFFSAFCPISGSPVEPEPDRAWRYGPGGGLPGVGGGTFEGTVYYCCWPCVCDTQAYLKVDTKTVDTLSGPVELHFLVYGDPCVDAGRIPEAAPDVACDARGRLEAATYSDGGHVIVGMLHTRDRSAQNAVEEVEGMCRDRAREGYQSGMGKIFIDVASINAI